MKLDVPEDFAIGKYTWYSCFPWFCIPRFILKRSCYVICLCLSVFTRHFFLKHKNLYLKNWIFLYTNVRRFYFLWTFFMILRWFHSGWNNIRLSRNGRKIQEYKNSVKGAGIIWLNRWFYFFINLPKTPNWQFLQLDLEFSSIQKKFSFVIFQYGGAQYEWSSSLSRFPPKFSTFIN